MNELEQLQMRCVSHEIRNHISICEMYSEIIKKHLNMDAYSNESVDNALVCIQKSLKIIGNVLMDLKLINNLEQKECDIGHLVHTALNLSRAYAIGKNITFMADDFVSAKVFLDENKFVASLVNIIKNGIEAIENTGYIEVKTIIDNENVCVFVSNNGKPIPESKINEIFNCGYTTKSTGSGLGLCICKQTLNSQNAEIKITESTDKKTTFEIIIPLM